NPVVTQPPVGAIYVLDDDGDMLEPTVVAARVRRDRPPARREVLDQLERLVTEAQPDDPHPESEHTLQSLPRVAGRLEIRHRLQAEHVAVEGERAIHVRHGHTDGVHSCDLSAGGGEADERHEERRGYRHRPADPRSWRRAHLNLSPSLTPPGSSGFQTAVGRSTPLARRGI